MFSDLQRLFFSLHQASITYSPVTEVLSLTQKYCPKDWQWTEKAPENNEFSVNCLNYYVL